MPTLLARAAASSLDATPRPAGSSLAELIRLPVERRSMAWFISLALVLIELVAISAGMFELIIVMLLISLLLM